MFFLFKLLEYFKEKKMRELIEFEENDEYQKEKRCHQKNIAVFKLT
mgnify:CR=1 FL=1